MNIVVRGRNLEVTPRLQEYVDTKVGKLDRFMPSIDEARMELSTEQTQSAQHSQIAQLTVRARGRILRAEERHQDIFAAIDAVTDKMQRQVSRYKDRLYSRGQPRSAAEAEAISMGGPGGSAQAEKPLGHIVRTKKFPVEPMDPEEAIEQMEMLGHDFFMFFNTASEAINVLYRRRNGDYGLLQPDRN
ncbi:MAG TPA: ribosome-associated translation inhibitor RaiA [Anaerolineae bacterium]|nr:ribosome-associated translation inhibitor RaiA [Anaerolineae bacterium]